MAGYVSDAVIRRLPGYYRHLKELAADGVTQISSQGLGERMGLTASQIRQDINCFGGFGRQGYGYSVPELRDHIGKILGVDQPHSMVILGAGNIGKAVALSDSFPANGFHTVAVFDNDTKKIGTKIGEIDVLDIANIEDYLAHNKIEIIVMAVPVSKAQALADQMCACGIRAFWNFVPADLKLPGDAVVVNVHLDEGLEILSFKMAQADRA